jgi:hypothetical protein
MLDFSVICNLQFLLVRVYNVRTVLLSVDNFVVKDQRITA